MADLVREAYEARVRDAYVDPVPLRQDAIRAIYEQLPETMANLKGFGYPDHMRIVDTGTYVAWYYEYIPAKLQEAPRQRGKPTQPPTLIPGRFIHLVISDDGENPPVGELFEGTEKEFKPFDSNKLNVVELWGVRGFLQVLAKEPKRLPWDE